MSKMIALAIVFIAWFICNVANRWDDDFYFCDSFMDNVFAFFHVMIFASIAPAIGCGLIYIIFL